MLSRNCVTSDDTKNGCVADYSITWSRKKRVNCDIFFLFRDRLKRPHLDIGSKEASAILDSVHKKTKVFGCNLENYLKVSVCP